MKKIIKEEKHLILFGILLFLINWLTPINGDDWGNYFIGQNNLLKICDYTLGMYYSWEGRLISRFLIFLLTYHKFLWSLITTIMLIGFIKSCYSFFNQDTPKIIYFIPFLLLFLVNNIFLTQSYFWIAGNITYIYPSILVIIVLIYLYKHNGKYQNIFEKILLIIASIIIPMFVENIGCAFLLAMFLMVGYHYLINKKVSLLEIIMLIFSMISLIFMLKSPGSANRMYEEKYFMDMSLLGKVFYNIPNFIYYTYNRNAIILFFMIIIINKMFYQLLKKRKTIFLIVTILFNIIPLISIIENIGYILPIEINFNWGNFNTANWHYVFYWIIFTGTWFYAIYYFLKEYQEKWFLIILVLIGFASVFVMVMTPVWGDRVTALYVFSTIFVITRILSIIYTSNKINYKFLKLLLVISLLRIGGYSLINSVFDMRRVNLINQQVSSEAEVILLPVNKLDTLWQYNPYGEYHLKVFKDYANISDKEVVMKTFSWKEYIIYLLKGEISEVD